MRRRSTTAWSIRSLLGIPLSLRQGHGWWDHVSNCARCDETVLATVDSEAEAQRIYEEQRAKILAMGFVQVRSGRWTVPPPASARG